MDNQLKRYSINQSARQDGISNTSGRRDIHTGFRSIQLVVVSELVVGVHRVVWGLCASLYANRAIRHHYIQASDKAELLRSANPSDATQFFSQSNVEDGRRTLQESFPVQAFEQQQSHAGWGLFPPQCYSTSTGSYITANTESNSAFADLSYIQGNVALFLEIWHYALLGHVDL